VGYVATSMIRPSNCASRWLWSLRIVAILTVKAPAVAAVRLRVRWPATELVRPTATFFWPDSTSFTRHPGPEPVVAGQVPASGVSAVAGPDPVVPGLAVAPRPSGAGAGPSMKWMEADGTAHASHPHT